MIAAMLVQGLLGAALVVLGRWGRAHAPELPSIVAADDERARLAGIYRRGGTACIVVGCLLLLVAVVPPLLGA